MHSFLVRASSGQCTKSFNTFSVVPPKANESEWCWEKRMVVQELLGDRMRAGLQTCAINDRHLHCQEHFATQASRRNQRHVCGRGLAGLWVQPNDAAVLFIYQACKQPQSAEEEPIGTETAARVLCAQTDYLPSFSRTREYEKSLNDSKTPLSALSFKLQMER